MSEANVRATKKWVYAFEEGHQGMRDLLGGKGANLAEMTRIGLPVPPGFTITTEACTAFYENGRKIPDEVWEQTKEALRALEQKLGKRFGDPENPLLVSVRSGAPVSMPGMMDTILNLGLNDETVEGLARLTGDRRFAFDAYRRFIQMYGDVVLGIPHARFEEIIEEIRAKEGVASDPEVSAAGWEEVVRRYKELVLKATGSPFPQDPYEQLYGAVRAVFDSWNNQRAIVYRKLHKIPDTLGTAVNVQAMVFGNMGDDSGTGVAFSRNPSTGEKVLYGEFLTNAQGEDVVAGIRTPEPIERLKERLPGVYEEFTRTVELLERHYKDMQDIEFTVERGKLYFLQTRTGKRTPQAAVRIAVEMVEEGLIDKETALLRVDPEVVVKLLHRRIDENAKLTPILKGLPASPGAGSGRVVFDADEAEAWAKEGEKVILVRAETTPDDIHGMAVAQGILTSRGGMTSHAAVVARGMGKPAVVGAEALRIDEAKGEAYVGDIVIRKGDVISLDGGTGYVYLGEAPLVEPTLGEHFRTLLEWADEVRRLGVRANADTPEDARRAREFGAEGIGLARTEHMFFAPERIPIVQEMILAETEEERAAALEKLLPMQEGDFTEIFRVMDGLPVTVRLLDPPLHEFLPNYEELLLEVEELRRDPSRAAELREKEALLRKVRALREANPMLGHRGTRLGITHPEIYAMQARAIFRAAFRLKREGYDPRPEIMIPLVGHVRELELMREVVERVYQEVREEFGFDISYLVGTMIEIPRACVTADEIARVAEFFSFGTNDLTQTTFGFSRDDAEGKFLQTYLEKKILKDNPFIVLDRDGVGALMRIAVEKGRSVRPQLKLGICGEHGGDPSSVEFCHMIGLDYVSASPYRVPVARLAAAQAAIREKTGQGLIRADV
ncbi:pyruvate, phosphate dikinase [Brockia lithotrophica]|uniref:Pyruvate, phosphate dikinase n=1 Tax=Brockia lithotrophica TaxID=933949 RepID=A0A660L4W6_9BACL|nr:pyruvate, phosphate dikinase [Brockia lithotrophica]RKQ88977.1 pyruvate phosphate dikinase [Brockia lithotrophica]